MLYVESIPPVDMSEHELQTVSSVGGKVTLTKQSQRSVGLVVLHNSPTKESVPGYGKPGGGKKGELH